MQRFAKVPVHAATILKCAEAAVILERIRELTVGEYGRGQFCEATAKWWAHSTPWISVRRVQDVIKRLTDEGYIIRVQNYDANTGHKSSSMYAITAKGLEILSIQKVSDLVNPEAVALNDKEVSAYLEANAGIDARADLTPDPALGRAESSVRLTPNPAHLLDSISIRHYKEEEVASLPVCSQQPEKAAVSKEPSLQLPPHLDTPAFRTAWAEFASSRKKSKLTPLAITKLINKLTPFDERTCIQAIDASIASGWTGLFPESVRNGRKAGQPESTFAKL